MLTGRPCERDRKLSAAFFIAVAVFALAQIFASIHATKYGDGQHDHGGQVCVLSLAAPGGDKYVPTAVLAAIAMVFTLWRLNFASPRAAQVLVRIHALRSRGPPSR